MSCTPNVGVGGIRLLGTVAIWQFVLGQKGAHLGAATKFADECSIKPRLVNAQCRVGEQAISIEPLDVVAFIGAAIAPDIDVVLLHRAHQQRAGHGATEGSGVEICFAGGADVECAALQGNQAFVHQLLDTIHHASNVSPILLGTRRNIGEVGLVGLPKVGGVGAGDCTFGFHPGNCSRSIEPARKSDADSFATGQRCEHSGHGRAANETKVTSRAMPASTNSSRATPGALPRSPMATPTRAATQPR